MNRQEALKKLQNYIDWSLYDEEYDEETGQKQKQNLEDIIKYLKQPITLIDYLGWEEDVEYDVLDERYKVVDKKLYWFDDRYNEWLISFLNKELIEFQKAKKIQPKKYYLELKEKYCKFYGIMNSLIYLNINKKTEGLLLASSNSFGEFQAKFTKEEIEDIKKMDRIFFEQFEMIEVGEDE